jgi:hypothetical protein
MNIVCVYVRVCVRARVRVRRLRLASIAQVLHEYCLRLASIACDWRALHQVLHQTGKHSYCPCSSLRLPCTPAEPREHRCIEPREHRCIEPREPAQALRHTKSKCNTWCNTCTKYCTLVAWAGSAGVHPKWRYMKHSLFGMTRTGHKMQSSNWDFSVQFGPVVNYSVEYLPVAVGLTHECRVTF